MDGEGLSFMDPCLHKEKQCAISKGPCPGVCVYADILGNINLGIIVLDVKNEKVIFQNGFSEEIFKDVIDASDFDTICALLLPDLYKYLSLAEPGFSRNFEFGNRLFGYTIYSIVEDFVWIFISDITEKERLRSIAEAMNTMDNIGYIFSGIRHEIGNPVNSIKMTISVLKKNLDTFSADTVREYVDRTLSEIERIEYLFKTLKNFNMYEEMEIQDVYLPSFVNDFLSLARKDFEAKGISIITNFEPEAEWVFADPRALQQVLLNILTNAADALEVIENDVIDIRISKDSKKIMIRVSDNGCGMSEKEQKDLFKPFYTTKKKGTGLGLVIAKNMLAKMNSTIEVESYKNIGTIVKLTLPEGSKRAVHDRKEADVAS
jgi:signal transduction histidine kinase